MASELNALKRYMKLLADVWENRASSMEKITID